MGLGPAVPACGGSTGNAAATGPTTPLSDVPAKFSTALCGVLAQCLGPALKFTFPNDDCESREKAMLEQGDFSIVQKDIDAGKVTYDGTKVDACVSALQAAGCDVLTRRLSTLCPAVIVGSAAEGAACTTNAECKAPLFCKKASCPGTCATLLSAGEDCKHDDDCQDGLKCSTQTKKCVKPAADGATCEGPTGPSCASDHACKGGNNATPGTCIPVNQAFAAAEGETCDPTTTTFCADGLACALTGVVNNKTQFQCKARSTGSSCSIAYPEDCPNGQYCVVPDPKTSFTGTCTPLPAAGSACGKHVPSDLTSNDQFCAPGTVCVQQTCHALQNLGEACTVNAECVSGLCDSGGCAPTECAGT
jgi:hypothetical protein